MSDAITVMVTGVGGGGHGEQILKALRLAKKEYSIIGTDLSKNSLGLLKADVPYTVPHASHPEYMHDILKICRKHRVRALFHGSEPEMRVMATNRERIEAAGIFLPINPNNVLDICLDKSKTARFLEKKGFNSPKNITVRCPADLEEIDFLPAVIKPSIGGGGSANTMLAQTKGQLMMCGEYLSSLYDEFIVQEYIGTPESEFSVGVLMSMDGALINSIAVNRSILSALSNRIKVPNQTNDPRFGKFLAISSGVSQGRIGKFPEVTGPCEQIAQTLGCKGPVNIQCRYVNNKVYVFEINARFSGTTSLRAMVGYNEPDLLVRKHVLGEEIAANFEYESGYIARGLEEAFVTVALDPRRQQH